MSKLKRPLSLIVLVVMVMTMVVGFSTNASALDVVRDNKMTAEELQQINKPSTLISTPIQLQPNKNMSQILNSVQFKKPDGTGKQLAINQRKTMIKDSQPAASGGVISNNNGTLQGTLTSDNSVALYLFSRTTTCLSISKLITNNQNYMMTLGVVDYQNSKVTLTNYSVVANQQYAINLPVGDYAWVIQSKDASYGDSFTLQYNMSLPMNTSSILYLSDDYQKAYTLDNGSLKLNGQARNLDYKYTIEWKTNISTGAAWHTEHIWMENANINSAIHIGGFQYKYGDKYVTYPHTIVLTVGVGGKFTHYLDQNPPRVFHNYNDMAGKYTPRAIDSDDISNRGGHYLVYDLDTNTVKEFVSGLSREWSSYGDKSQPKLIK